MHLKNELKVMLREDYVNPALYKDDNTGRIEQKLHSLRKDLDFFWRHENNVTDRVLELMTELFYYKRALSTNIVYSTSMGKEQKKYLNARMALTVITPFDEKPIRVTANYYLGEMKDFLNNNGEVDSELIAELSKGPLTEKLVTKILEMKWR
jgi:hypothetical protein